MKVLFLSTHLNTGGITSYLLTLTKGLVQRNHEVFIVTSGGDMEQEFAKNNINLLTLDIRTKSELSPKIYFNLLKLRRMVIEKDIDIIHSQTRVTQVLGQILKWMTGRKYVSTCHGFFKARISRRMFPFWGDRVIAISDVVSSHLERDFRVPKEKIDVINNGIDIQAYYVTSDEKKIQKRQNFSLGSGPIIGMIARLSDVKGQDILISSFHKVLDVYPDAKLLLVGEGKLEPLLRKLVESLKMNDNVIFMPIINRTAEILPIFDVFVMPSRQEGLGISVMEAQAAGLPVVASKVGGLPSLIEHNRTGILVNPGDIEGFSNAMIELLADRRKALDMGLKARKAAEQNYSSEYMVEQTMNTYKKVITS